MDVEKRQWVTLSNFRHCETFFLHLFSLQKVPFQLDILQQIGCVKIPKGPLFQFFGIVRLVFENLFFLQRVPLQLRQKCWQFRKCPPFSAPGARTSGSRRATRFILTL